MNNPTYKSIKVAFATWQTITRISAVTGESRSAIVDRLANAELKRLQQIVVENIDRSVHGSVAGGTKTENDA